MNRDPSHIDFYAGFHSDNPHDMEPLTLSDEARRDAIAKLTDTAAKLSAEADKMASTDNVYSIACVEMMRDVWALEKRDTFKRGVLMLFQMHYSHALRNLLNG